MWWNRETLVSSHCLDAIKYVVTEDGIPCNSSSTQQTRNWEIRHNVSPGSGDQALAAEHVSTLKTVVVNELRRRIDKRECLHTRFPIDIETYRA